MAADPDVLVRIAQEEGEGIDDRLAVGDEGGAGAALEPPVPEERDERGDVDEVVFARDLHALHGLVGDVGSVAREDLERGYLPRPNQLGEAEAVVAVVIVECH